MWWCICLFWQREAREAEERRQAELQQQEDMARQQEEQKRQQEEALKQVHTHTWGRYVIILPNTHTFYLGNLHTHMQSLCFSINFHTNALHFTGHTHGLQYFTFMS